MEFEYYYFYLIIYFVDIFLKVWLKYNNCLFLKYFKWKYELGLYK